jgi:hypothetical protein
MDTAVDIRVVLFIEVHQCLDDTPRFLGCRGIIEIYQPVAVYLAGQDWKLGGDGFYIHYAFFIRFDIQKRL